MDANGSLNHVYRTVWNQALGAMVAVAEIAGSRRKARGARSGRGAAVPKPFWPGFALSAVGFAVVCGSLPLVAVANPSGAVAVQGQATLQSSGNHLQVTTQNGAGLNHSVINWQSFSIPAGSSTYFQQPSASSTSINRVVTSTPSLIFGSLGSNGHLVLVNQSGITVGAGAVVDTAGFTAAAMRMSDADALAGRMRFGDAATAAGALSVQGSVLARSGDVVLLGSRLDTGASALVQTPNGSTILGAGQQIEITGRGLEGIVMQVQAPADSVVNLGTLQGDAVGVFAGTLKHSGQIEATRVSVEGGKVILQASADALVQGASRTLARSASAHGGVIQVLGKRVGVTDSALIDASGATGGGTVLVGGDYQGKNAAVQNATVSYVGPQTTLRADAIGTGDGGKVVVWADDTTRVSGSLSAQGGAGGGDGGLVETSGHRYLEVAGARVNTLAANGQTGTWLLDPTDVTIVQGGLSQVNPLDATGLFNVGSGATATLTDGDINYQMYNTNITVQTASAASGAGDIVFDSTAGAVAINNITTATGTRLLTLNADRNIVFKGSNGTTFTGTSQPLTVLLNPLSATGKIVTEGSALVTANGTTVNGASNPTVLQVAAGKTWENLGTLNLEGDATVALNTAAVFSNAVGAVGNLGSIYSAFSSPGASPSLSDGIVRNDGTLNIKADTTIAAAYSQTGTLNIEGVALSLTNAKSVRGVIDLAPGNITLAGELNVIGNQGSVAQFQDLIIRKTASVTNTPVLNVRAGSAAVGASFSNVVAPDVALQINLNADTSDQASVLITGGASSFASLIPDQSNIWALTINNGTLGLTSGGLNVSSANTTLTGNAALFARGALNIQSAYTTTGNLHFISGWNGDLTTPAAKLNGPWNAPLTVSGALSAAKLGLESSDAVTLNAALTVTGPLDIRARAGSIAPSASSPAQTFALQVTGATKLVASGDVNLAHTGNTFAGLDVSAGGSVNIAAASGLALGNISGTSVTLDAAGAITQGATQSITTTGQQYSNGGNGGAVNVYGSSLALGTVDASGVGYCTDGGCADGGNGGSVLLHAKSGNFSGTIVSKGGDAGTAGGNGGAGGAVNLVMNGVTVNGVAVPNNGVASLSTATFQTQGGAGSSVGSVIGVNGAAGVWRVYADSPSGVSKGGLTSDFRQYNATYFNYQGQRTGNGFIYASAPGALKVDTTLSSGTGSHTYGNTPDAVFGYVLSGFADGEDTASNIGLAGTAAFTQSFANTTNAGSYTQQYASGLSSTLGYTFAAQNGIGYTVNQRPLSVGTNAITKIYDGSTTVGGTPIVVGGSLFANDALSGGSLAFADPNAGIGNKTVNASGVSVVDGNGGANYLVSYVANTTSSIAKRDITLASLSAANKDYDGTTVASITGASFGNLAGSETLGLSGSGAFADRNAANGKVVTVADVSALTKANGTGLWSNYNLTTTGSATTTANIAKKAVTLTASSVSKTYDGTLGYTTQSADLAALGSQLGVSGDTVSTATIAFTDRNKGSNKSVTLGSVAVSDGNGGNNYTVTLAGNNTSTITQAASASWVGGSTGLWSQASNWTVLPDGANVLAVNIPTGTTVNFDANAADTTLQALNSLGTLAVTGSNLAITNALVTSQFNQTGGTVRGAGSLTVGSSFSQTGGSIAMGGSVSISQASGDLAVASVQGSSIALQAVSGAVRQTGALVTDGLLTVRATDGIVLTNTTNAVRALLASNTGNGDLRLVNNAVLDVQGVTVANGKVDIDNTGGFSNSGAIAARGGTVDVRTHSPLSINSSVVAGGNITLAALTPDGTSNITINSPMTSTGGGISIQAYNNFIQNSGLNAALGIDVSTVSGSLLFGPSAFSVGNPISYAVNGATYVPPWIAATLSGGATDYVATFMDQFEAALQEQAASSDDPLGLALRTREGVTVEGEICKP